MLDDDHKRPPWLMGVAVVLALLALWGFEAWVYHNG